MNAKNVGIVVLLSALVSCFGTPQEAPRSTPLGDRERRAWYDRTDVAFETGVLYTPGNASPPDDAGWSLAPLIILQTVETEPGGLPAAPDVYYEVEEITLRGQTHESWTYVWEQADGGGTRTLRMTLGSDGYPLAYEVLGDSSGGRLLFVTTSLEEAAAAEFGPPLPGRQFSVERDTRETPGVIVGGVVEPGSTPLGPFVYVWSGGDVNTVICRCMPSMVDRIDGTLPYKLRPMTLLADDFEQVPERLESLLRFPSREFSGL